MKRSIQTKITLYNTLIIIIPFLIMTLIIYQVTTVYLNNRVRDDLIEDAQIIMTTLLASIDDEATDDTPSFETFRNSTIKLSRFRLTSQVNLLTVFPKGSEVIGDPGDLSKADLFNIVSGNPPTTPFDLIAEDGSQHLVIYAQLPAGRLGGRITDSYLIISIEKSSIKAFSQQIVRSQLLIALILAMLAAVVSASYAGTLIKPLRQLNRTAKRISRKDYPAPLMVSTGDEIEELAHSINAMSASLKASDEKQWRFFQNASHELKTPLMSIQGYTEGMIDGIFDRDTEHLTIINQEVKRLTNIVNNIAYLSRIDAIADGLDLELVPIDAVVQDSVKKLKGLYSASSIDIQMNLQSRYPLKLDRDQMTQALINILSNGLRYAKSLILITLVETDSEILLTVTDDGDGIPKDNLPYVFERFHKGDKGQSGLGLSITQSIIEKHGGTITAGNSMGSGACFTIRLNK